MLLTIGVELVIVLDACDGQALHVAVAGRTVSASIAAHMSQGAGHLGTLWRQEGIRGICSSDRATGASSTVNTAAAVRKEEVTPLLLSGLILLLFAPVDAEEGETAEENEVEEARVHPWEAVGNRRYYRSNNRQRVDAYIELHRA